MPRKVTWLLTIFLIICFGGLIFTLVRSASLSAAITVNAVPKDSIIRINGHEADQGKNKLKPGSYTVEVSHSGFTTVKQTVSVTENSSRTVDIVLVSNSSQTANWYYTHPDDAKAAEGASDRNVDNLSKSSLNNGPLIKLLPFVAGGLAYRIDYGNEPGSNADQPVIFITAPSQEQQQAGVNWIKSVGFNPEDYTIRFVTAEVRP